MSEVVSVTNNEYLEAITLSRVVQRGDYSFIVHEDQSVSMILQFRPLNENSTPEEIARVQNKFAEILKSLDPSITLQLVIKREEQTMLPDAMNVPEYLEPRINYLKELRKNHQIFRNRYFLSLYIKAEVDENQGNIFKKIFGKFSKVEDIAGASSKVSSKIENRLEKAAMLHDSILESFESLGMSVEKFSNVDSLFKNLLHYFNPTAQNKKVSSKGKEELLKDVNLKVRKKDFLLDGYFHKVWTLDRLPEQNPGKTIDLLKTVPVEFIFSMSMSKDLKGDSFQVTHNFILRVKESLRVELSQKQNISKEQTARLIESDLMDNVFSTFGGTEWATEEQASWNLFCFLVPGFSCLNNNILKSMNVPLDKLSSYLPMFGGDDDKKIQDAQFFMDLRGYLKSFPVKKEELQNSNYLFLGDKGSGKTTLIQTLLSSLDMTKQKIMVITEEQKNSYENILKIVDGKMIRLDDKKLPKINIFERGPKSRLQSKIDHVYSMLELILSSSHSRIDVYERVSSEALMRGVEKAFKGTPSVESLIENISSELDFSDPKQRKVASRLEEFFTPEMKNLFSTSTEVDLSSPFTVVDIRGMYLLKTGETENLDKALMQKLYYIAVNDLFVQKLPDDNGVLVKEDSPVFYELVKNSFMHTIEVEMNLTKKHNLLSIYAFEHLDKISAIEGLYEKFMPQFSRIFITKNSEDFNMKRIQKMLNLDKSVLPKMNVLNLEKKIQRDGSTKILSQKFMVVESSGVTFYQNLLSPFEKLYITPSADDLAIVDYYRNKYSSVIETMNAISEGAFLGDAAFLDFLENNGYRNLSRKVRNGEY